MSTYLDVDRAIARADAEAEADLWRESAHCEDCINYNEPRYSEAAGCEVGYCTWCSEYVAGSWDVEDCMGAEQA